MQKKYINKLDEDLLNKISNIENIRIGAYNIRKNGQGVERKATENINIVTKKISRVLIFILKKIQKMRQFIFQLF